MLLLLICLSIAISATGFAAIIHVDVTAPSGGTGSETNPYNSLPLGLGAANQNGGDTIKIADGVYTPGTSQSSSFALKKVHIVGGYPGYDVQNGWGTSNPDLYETILSGDINYPNPGPKAYTVVRATVSDMNPSNAILSNVSIQDAYNNDSGRGGGIFVSDGANPRFHRCKIRQNVATFAGAGVYIQKAGALFTRCIIEDNDIPEYQPIYQTFGAGIAAIGDPEGSGGSNVELINSIVRNNTLVKGFGGGGIAIHHKDSVLTMLNSLVVGNVITSAEVVNPYDLTGGGIHLFKLYVFPNDPGPTATLTNSVVANNIAGQGGGISCWATGAGAFTLTNSIVWANTEHCQPPPPCPETGKDVRLWRSTMNINYSDVSRSSANFFEWNSTVNTTGYNPEADPLFDTPSYRLPASTREIRTRA